jgi:uncharacterized membrane protein (UPF0182 family)
MSFIDQFEEGATPQPPRLRILRWAIPIGALIAVGVIGAVSAGIYTDWLWFEQLGYLSVYTTILTTRIALFIAGFAIFLAVFAVNVYFASKYSPHGVAPQAALNIPLEALAWARRLVTVGIVVGAVLLALVFGVAASGQWEVVLRFTNAETFGITDPIFNKDVSFYLFSLPFYRFLQGWLLGTVVVNGLVVLGIYAINFAIGGFQFSITPALRSQLSALGSVLFLLLALGYWMSTQEIMLSDQGAAFGAGYTDTKIRLPALNVLIALSIGVSLLLAATVFLRGTIVPIVGIGVWFAVLTLGTAVAPGLIQRFQVTPSEFALEEKFIERTIEGTRNGYALDRITPRQFDSTGALTPEIVNLNPGTIENIRLWDHRPLRDVYNQIQFIRLQYAFVDIDLDRYTVNGEYRQVMIGARELVQSQLDPGAQTWVNRKLQFTHGYGVAMSPVTEFTEEGLPEFLVKDIPPEPTSGGPSVTRPQIYYGEATNDWVIVNSRTKEFDHPTNADPVYRPYGDGPGVNISGFLRRLLFAWRFADVNIFITGEVNSDSKILYYRNIQDRVQHLAPFLELDRDPYVVAADDKLYWIQDLYTTSDLFPYSEPTPDGFNYIRNSVKAVIDAYDGSIDFYITDPEDGIIKTYAQVFPDLFKPFEELPVSLQSHLRYPEDFFLIQARKYLKFHMTVPQVFYNQEDLWQIPTEIFFEDSQEMQPYYMIMKLPDEEKEEFVLILPFTPANKPNLVGWLAARNDAPNYGNLIAFTFPKDRQVDGVQQVEARINIDPLISQQFTLWDTAGSRVLRGNLLVIPVGDTILYAEPLYLQAEALAYPQLTRVILAAQGGDPVMEDSLEAALAALLGGGTARPIGGEGTVTDPDASLADQVVTDFSRIQRSLADLQNELDVLSDRLRRALQPDEFPIITTPTPTPTTG